MSRKRILADTIFTIHSIVVLVILFGWLIPNIWLLYLATLVVALASELTLGYCFLSKWEFDLRKQLEPTLIYEYAFASYYTYTLTRIHISTRFIQIASALFLIASLGINIYFHFLT